MRLDVIHDDVNRFLESHEIKHKAGLKQYKYKYICKRFLLFLHFLPETIQVQIRDVYYDRYTCILLSETVQYK